MKEVLISELEKKRLIDEELDPGQRRQNTYRVKQKVKTWAEAADDIKYALDNLSSKAAANILDEQDLYKILDVAIAIAKNRDFAPVYKTRFGYIAIRNSIPLSPKASVEFRENGGIFHPNDKIGDWIRPSSDAEPLRNQQLLERLRVLLELVLDCESLGLLEEGLKRFPSEKIGEWRLKHYVDRCTPDEKLKASGEIQKVKQESTKLAKEDGMIRIRIRR